jgi:hypothetical protein
MACPDLSIRERPENHTVYGKLNSAGRFVNRRQTVDLNALFDRMSRDELETYAVSGI